MVPTSSRSPLARHTSLGVLLVAAAFAVPARAEEMVLHLDPAATKVSFELGATGHDVHGDVGGASGDLRFDPATGSASGEINVALGATATGSNSRDKTMHQDVLESARFPVATLSARGLEGTLALTGESQVTLLGTMRLHGAEHEVRLPAKVHIADGRLTGTATVEVPFKAWGMKDPSIMFLRVADQVHVVLGLAGDLAPAPPATGQPATENPAATAASSHGR